MIINLLPGFAASSMDSKETLNGFMDDVLKDMPDKPETIHRHLEYSSHTDCIEKSIQWMNTIADNKVLLVGKSMGGVRTWWMIYHYWQNILAKFHTDPSGKLGVLLIDPHGWQPGDGRIGSYGMVIDGLEVKPDWIRKDVDVMCVYQRNSYPKGAYLGENDDTRNIKLGDKADHWNVENYHTSTGKLVGKEIHKMIRWICE